MKEEEERLRAAMRRDSKVKRIKEKSTRHGLSSGYLEGEGDSEDSDEGLNALKNRYKQKKGGAESEYFSVTGCVNLEQNARGSQKR